VLELRARQMRNLLATVLLSQGVPMLLAGDEFARTQWGNNNAYCQDNATNWVDWSLLERNAALCEFVRQLIQVRRSRLWLRRDTFLKGAQRTAARDIAWLHPSGRDMTDADWNDAGLRSLAILMNAGANARQDNGDLLIVFNSDRSELNMTLPRGSQGGAWAVVFDTATEAIEYKTRRLNAGESLRVDGHSTVLLESSGP
jgi:glycogen operon protein